MLHDCGSIFVFVEKFPGVILDILLVIVYSYHTKLKPKNKHFITIFHYNTNFAKMPSFLFIPYLHTQKPRIKRPELSALCFQMMNDVRCFLDRFIRNINDLAADPGHDFLEILQLFFNSVDVGVNGFVV